MSGSQKRKNRKEKEYNINSKYAKLDNFLISATSSSSASSSSSNARELDEQGQAHPGIHKRRICNSSNKRYYSICIRKRAVVTSSMGVNPHLPSHNRFNGFTSWSKTSASPIDCP
ncbi:hypothetical protein TNCV_2205441 [Trichonephila clavipes]|nr:hypothetical protein TNCV_2205441 [Trichonephila clavipes]